MKCFQVGDPPIAIFKFRRFWGRDYVPLNQMIDTSLLRGVFWPSFANLKKQTSRYTSDTFVWKLSAPNFLIIIMIIFLLQLNIGKYNILAFPFYGRTFNCIF